MTGGALKRSGWDDRPRGDRVRDIPYRGDRLSAEYRALKDRMDQLERLIAEAVRGSRGDSL